MLHLVTTTDGLTACTNQLTATDTVVVSGSALTSYIRGIRPSNGRVVCFELDAERLGIGSIEPISYTEWLSLVFEQPVQTWS